MVMNEDVVRDAAYRKWQEAGEPPGDGVQFWLEAEQECNCTDDECAVEQAIDEASEESFPASDPPARGASLMPGIARSQTRRKK